MSSGRFFCCHAGSSKLSSLVTRTLKDVVGLGVHLTPTKLRHLFITEQAEDGDPSDNASLAEVMGNSLASWCSYDNGKYDRVAKMLNRVMHPPTPPAAMPLEVRDGCNTHFPIYNRALSLPYVLQRASVIRYSIQTSYRCLALTHAGNGIGTARARCYGSRLYTTIARCSGSNTPRASTPRPRSATSPSQPYCCPSTPDDELRGGRPRWHSRVTGRYLSISTISVGIHPTRVACTLTQSSDQYVIIPINRGCSDVMRRLGMPSFTDIPRRPSMGATFAARLQVPLAPARGRKLRLQAEQRSPVTARGLGLRTCCLNA